MAVDRELWLDLLVLMKMKWLLLIGCTIKIVYYQYTPYRFWRSSTFCVFHKIHQTFALETNLQFSSPFTWPLALQKLFREKL